MHINTLTFYKYIPKVKPEYAGKFCKVPYTTLTIDNDGDVMLCGCQSHMPYVIGNIYEDTLQNIWLSNRASTVRQSVVNGEFTYCNASSCNILPNVKSRPEVLPSLLQFPLVIRIDMDMSCNLKCPSCRTDIIIEKNSAKIEQQKKLYAELKEWAITHPQDQLTLSPINSGEIFASHSGLAFLKTLQDYPHTNLKLHINTNGTLISRHKDLLTLLKNIISICHVSIDAATPETYAKVRNGDWNDLMAGLALLKDLNIPLMLKFCIQKNNYHEIEMFAELAQQFGAKIDYQSLSDWGHQPETWWHQNSVLQSNSPEATSILESVARVQSKYKAFFF